MDLDYLELRRSGELHFMSDLTLKGNSEEVISKILDDGIFPSRFQLSAIYLDDISEKNFWENLNKLIEVSKIPVRIYDLHRKDIVLDFSFLLKLPSLTNLDIDSLTLSLTEILPQLKNLTTLNIGINDSEEKDISFLEKIPNLESLNFQKWFRKGKNIDVSPIKHLSKLKNLDLRGCDKNLELALSNKPNLEVLTLNNIQKIDANWLIHLQKLSALSLYKIKLSDLSPISQLQHLEYLQLWKINTITTLDFIPLLKNLVCLELNDNQNLENFPDVKGLKKLTYIQLKNSKISNFQSLKVTESDFHFEYFYETRKKEYLPSPKAFLPVIKNSKLLSFSAGSYIHSHSKKIEKIAKENGLLQGDGVTVFNQKNAKNPITKDTLKSRFYHKQTKAFTKE